LRNIYWYIGLAFISIGGAVLTFYRKRHLYKVSTLIIFYLFIAGFAWICEYLVLGLLNAYAYKTGVFADPWAQNLLGHLLLNTTLYPTAAIVTVTGAKRNSAILLFTVAITLIDYLFIKLGLYEHHWWRSFMTVITVVATLRIAVFWFERIKKGCSSWTRAVTFFFIALIIIHFPSPFLLLMRKQYYQFNIISKIFSNFYLTSIIFTFTYHLLESIELTLITCILKKRNFWILPLVIAAAAQCTFAALNLLVPENGWHLIYTLILYELFIGLFILAEKYTLRPAYTQTDHLYQRRADNSFLNLF
jgi:hypothetical protein